MGNIFQQHKNIIGSKNDIDKKTPSRAIYFVAINGGWEGDNLLKKIKQEAYLILRKISTT